METHPWNLYLFLFCGVTLYHSVFLQAYIVNSSWCFQDAGYYTRNSQYEMNLISILSSIHSKINRFGFYTESIGSSPNMVTAIMWCRADMQLHDCKSCISSASLFILTSCPFNMKAVFYYLDCTFGYTNGGLFGAQDTSATKIFWDSNDSIPNVVKLNDNLAYLLNSLQDKAVNGGSGLKAATGNAAIPSDFSRVYAFLQCMPYVSYTDCFQCLVNDIKLVPVYHYASSAHGICSPICRVQFATYLFFNNTRIHEVQTLLGSSSRTWKATRIGLIVLGLALAMAISIGMSIKYLQYLWQKRSIDRHPPTQVQLSVIRVDDIIEEESLQYDFDKIRLATNDFSQENVLGRGGFGVVYKGTLDGVQIAVKRLLGESLQGDREFKNEVTLLAKLQHRNLVKFYGFSIKETERLLIYEFLENGSLDKFIFDATKRPSMDWNIRYKIIEGIAKGLIYLHDDSGFCIIHRDLKLSNILLDDAMNPKIADFGLARRFMCNESNITTSILAGTHGYMAPEYTIQGEISVKTDVFTFGVLVLEIITGQRKTAFLIDGIQREMLTFAWDCWSKGNVDSMIDPLLMANCGFLENIVKCIYIGLLCVQPTATDIWAKAPNVIVKFTEIQRMVLFKILFKLCRIYGVLSVWK